MSVIVGTDVEYGGYQELGTGIYAEGGGGRPTPWVYQDEKATGTTREAIKRIRFSNRRLQIIRRLTKHFEDELKMDNETIKAIEAIIKRGNDAEIRRKGDGYIVLEVKKTIKYTASA